MTRWLTLVLLIINLVVLARGYQAEKHSVRDSGAVGRYPSLVLLREQGSPQLEADQRADLPDGGAVMESDRSGAPPEREAGEEKKMPTATASRGTEIALAGVPAAEPPQIKEEGGGAESPAEEPRSAGWGSPPPDRPEESQTTPRFEVSQRQAPMCYTAGPFDTRVAAERVEEELGSLADSIAVRDKPESVVTGYWVLIPALPSASEAIAEVGRIKAAGFKDVWRFTKGDMANSISLGFFSRQEQASAHNKRVAERGFPSEVRPRYTEKARFWLDWRASGDAAVAQTDLAARAAESGEYTIETRECP